MKTQHCYQLRSRWTNAGSSSFGYPQPSRSTAVDGLSRKRARPRIRRAGPKTGEGYQLLHQLSLQLIGLGGQLAEHRFDILTLDDAVVGPLCGIAHALI